MIAAGGVNVQTVDQSGNVVTETGNSFAAPAVAGAAALLKQYWPQLGGKAISRILLDTATDAGAPGVDQVFGVGILDVEKAMQAQAPASSFVAAQTVLARYSSLTMSAPFGGGAALAGKVGSMTVLDRYGRDYRMTGASGVRTRAGNTQARHPADTLAHQGASTGSVDVKDPALVPAFQPAAPATPAWLTAVITAGAALAGVLIANLFARRTAFASMVQKGNEAEIAAIDTRLSAFLGPFVHLSAENLALSTEMKRRYGGDSFRTLPALLSPGWLDGLSKGDRKLVSVVVENGLRLRQLILDNSGAVSPALLPYFAAASTHFRLLDLAHSGSLDLDPERYAAYVYPRQLDDVIRLERERLEARRGLLRAKPDTSHQPMQPLVLPQELRLESITA